MTSVFVGELHSDITEADLARVFSQIGTVLSVKIFHDEENTTIQGYGFVTFQKPEEAESAARLLNLESLNGQTIRVNMADKTCLRPFLRGNVLVKNLERSVDSGLLQKTFAPYGNILSCKVPHGKKGSKCHGFVHFENEAAATCAIEELNGSTICGKKILVTHLLNRDPREILPEIKSPLAPDRYLAPSSIRTVYIKNLGPAVDSAMLKSACSQCGEVSSVKIIRDADGSSKGFAFVTFKKIKDAAQAMDSLNGTQLDGRVLFAGPAIKKAGKRQKLPAPNLGTVDQALVPVHQPPPSPALLRACLPNISQQQQQFPVDTTCTSGISVNTTSTPPVTTTASGPLPVYHFQQQLHHQLQQQQQQQLLMQNQQIQQQQQQQQQHEQHSQRQQQQQFHQQQQEPQLHPESFQQLCTPQNVGGHVFDLCDLGPITWSAFTGSSSYDVVVSTKEDQPMDEMQPQCQQIQQQVRQQHQELQIQHHHHLLQQQQYQQPHHHLLLHQEQHHQQQQANIQHQQNHHQQQQQHQMNVQQQQQQQQQQTPVPGPSQQQPTSSQPQLQQMPNQQQQQPEQLEQPQQQPQQLQPLQQQPQQLPQQQQQQLQHNPAGQTPANQGVNLYVKHLDDEVDDATLKAMFSRFGEVISAKVMMEGDKSRGFGFVCFAKADDAARATRDMRGRVDDVNRKPLYVAPAQRKEERQAFFREKLKCRQLEMAVSVADHSPMEGSVKLDNPMDFLKDTDLAAPTPNDMNTDTTLVNCPQGGIVNTNAPPPKREPSSWICDLQTSTPSSAIHQEEGSSLESPRRRFEYARFCRQRSRSLFKKRNLFNLENFDVENLRKPLIQPACQVEEARSANASSGFHASSAADREPFPNGSSGFGTVGMFPAGFSTNSSRLLGYIGSNPNSSCHPKKEAQRFGTVGEKSTSLIGSCEESSLNNNSDSECLKGPRVRSKLVRHETNCVRISRAKDSKGSSKYFWTLRANNSPLRSCSGDNQGSCDRTRGVGDGLSLPCKKLRTRSECSLKMLKQENQPDPLAWETVPERNDSSLPSSFSDNNCFWAKRDSRNFLKDGDFHVKFGKTPQKIGSNTMSPLTSSPESANQTSDGGDAENSPLMQGAETRLSPLMHGAETSSSPLMKPGKSPVASRKRRNSDTLQAEVVEDDEQTSNSRPTCPKRKMTSAPSWMDCGLQLPKSSTSNKHRSFNVVKRKRTMALSSGEESGAFSDGQAGFKRRIVSAPCKMAVNNWVNGSDGTLLLYRPDVAL